MAKVAREVPFEVAQLHTAESSSSSRALESLDSLWVKFEIDEAFYGVVQRKLRKVLVLFLGNSITIDKLPEWLKRAKAVVVNSPKNAAREISPSVKYLTSHALSESENEIFEVGKGGVGPEDFHVSDAQIKNM